jgi:hypothetical protein
MIALEIGLCLVLGGVFLFSSIPKLRYPKGFVFAVLTYAILPPSLSTVYAVLVPPLEFLIGLGFILGTAVRADGVLMALLLVSYIVAVRVNMTRGRELECNCFGSMHKQPIGWRLMLQDSVLLVAALFVAVLSPNWLGPEQWSVFRLTGLASAGSFVPFLICTSLALLGTLLSHASGWKRKKPIALRTHGKTRVGPLSDQGGF